MTFENFKQLLEQEIKSLFAKEINTAPTAEFKLLLERMSALILRGGKRARPELLFLTYEAYGGQHPESLIDVCLALELHHQFLLIHDDIIDNDTVRYDGPNITGYYQADAKGKNLRLPEAMALLAGDLAFTFAYQAIEKSKRYSAEQKTNFISLLNETNVRACVGQQLDALESVNPISDFSLDRMLRIHELKCAEYSTKMPMHCAATLLSLDNSELRRINAFAEPFGILFQLVDDHSDYFENKSAFNNHPKFRDFCQGNTTYPLFAGFEKADKSQREFIKDHFGQKNTTEGNMKKVVAILKECGGETASCDLVKEYFKKSSAALESLGVNPDNKKVFRRLLERFDV